MFDYLVGRRKYASQKSSLAAASEFVARMSTPPDALAGTLNVLRCSLCRLHRAGELDLPQATIFDLDGTLLDSVDLHAISWHEAMVKFGHEVSFEQARSQIGKGGDKLVPFFLSPEEQNDHGRELEEWRGRRFKSRYLSLIRPFSAVPDLLQRVREAGLRVAVASSAKRDELEHFLEIAGVTRLVDEASSSEDVDESKPAPDVFEAVLKRLKINGEQAIAIGDSPYDAEAAGKANVRTIGVLCGGSTRVRFGKPDAQRCILDRLPSIVVSTSRQSHVDGPVCRSYSAL